MTKTKNVVVIGAKETGKTTLVNALLGWDFLPQSYDGIVISTTRCECRQMTESVYLTDTPGYSLLWETVPEETAAAASLADTVIVMLSEELAEEDIDLPSVDPEWEGRRAAEAALLRSLLENRKNRDVYFVIPFDATYWPDGEVPLTQALRLARKRFSAMSCHGDEGFFCIDPMLALIGAIEDDPKELEDSGILPLKARLIES